MKKVLIIEDNEDNLYMIKFILEHNKMEVVWAKNGMEGINFVMNEAFDLVLMDIQLPDINGLDVTEKIRELIPKRDLPIVAISSYAMPGDRQKALKAGCTGYIEKPINPETIMDEINRFL